ncbi:hypothetical protein Dimus_006513 [Dionaea muscipula]
MKVERSMAEDPCLAKVSPRRPNPLIQTLFPPIEERGWFIEDVVSPISEADVVGIFGSDPHLRLKSPLVEVEMGCRGGVVTGLSDVKGSDGAAVTSAGDNGILAGEDDVVVGGGSGVDNGLSGKSSEDGVGGERRPPVVDAAAGRKGAGWPELDSKVAGRGGCWRPLGVAGDVSGNRGVELRILGAVFVEIVYDMIPVISRSNDEELG